MNMKQNIEKYLKENRIKLDVEEPDHDSIWEGIRSGNDKKRNLLPAWFWKVAAVFIFLVSGTYFIINETKEEKTVIISLADISENLGKQENALKQLVNLKWEEVAPLLNEENTDIKFLLEELYELDTFYNSYEKDLGTTDANEEIITVLLDYYQKKIRILNRILHEIQKQQSHENTISI